MAPSNPKALLELQRGTIPKTTKDHVEGFRYKRSDSDFIPIQCPSDIDDVTTAASQSMASNCFSAARAAADAHFNVLGDKHSAASIASFADAVDESKRVFFCFGPGSAFQ